MTYELLHGDCLSLMKDIPDNSIDMILCDMPYGTTQCKWDSVLDLPTVWNCINRVTKVNTAVCLFSAQPFTSVLVNSNLTNYRTEWIWEKPAATGFFNAKIQPLRAHENIVIFYRKKPTYNPQITHGHQRKTARKHNVIQSECYGKEVSVQDYDSTSRYPRDIIRFSSDKQLSNLHPTQKPVSICEYLIKTYSNKGEIVLDFTMGSGSTGVACLNTDRKFIGIEKDDNYFNVAKNRIEQHELFLQMELE